MRLRLVAMYVATLCLLTASAEAQAPGRWAAFDPNSEASAQMAWGDSEEEARKKAIAGCKRSSKTCAGSPATTADLMDVMAHMCCDKPRRGCAASFRSSRLKAREGVQKVFDDAGFSSCQVRAYLSARTGKTISSDLTKKDISDHYDQGIEAYDKGKFDDAVAAFNRVIGIDAKIGDVYRIRGKARRSLSLYDDAIADFNKAIELDQRDEDAFYMRGAVRMDISDYENALADFNRSIELEPNNKFPHNGRGNARRKLGDPSKAIGDYTRSITIDPKFAVAYNNRGDAYRDLVELDAAIRDYTQAAELEPGNAAYRADVGYARFHKGAFREAAVDLLRALEKTDNAYIMLFRYLSLARAGDTAEPELEANASRLKNKSWPFAVIEMLAGKRTPEATLPAAVKPDEICEAHFYIGEWHLLRGDKDAATRMFELATSTCKKDFLEYHAANAELRRLRQ